jgi:hypothetical protein
MQGVIVMSEADELFNMITERGIKPFASGPFRFFGLLDPNPVPRDSKAKLIFVCKNIENKNARADILLLTT